MVSKLKRFFCSFLQAQTNLQRNVWHRWDCLMWNANVLCSLCMTTLSRWETLNCDNFPFWCWDRSCTGSRAQLTRKKIDLLVCLGSQLYISHHSRYQLASPWEAALTALLFLCRFSVIQVSNAVHAVDWPFIHGFVERHRSVIFLPF